MATTDDDDPGVNYYKAPDTTVRQGDIVRLGPHFRALKPPLLHVSVNKTTKKDRVYGELLGGEGSPLPGRIVSGEKDTEFIVPGRLDTAILVTRGCDIENGIVAGDDDGLSGPLRRPCHPAPRAVPRS